MSECRFLRGHRKWPVSSRSNNSWHVGRCFRQFFRVLCGERTDEMDGHNEVLKRIVFIYDGAYHSPFACRRLEELCGNIRERFPRAVKEEKTHINE